MKILLDENLPPALARALFALFEGNHQIIHLREKFGPKVSDIEWISVLSAEGGWAVISGDRRITRNKAEQNAFRSSKIVGFFLSRSVQRAQMTRQMQRILALWPEIERVVASARGGEMYEVPIKSIALKRILK